jgi:hypothetical protein
MAAAGCCCCWAGRLPGILARPLCQPAVPGVSPFYTYPCLSWSHRWTRRLPRVGKTAATNTPRPCCWSRSRRASSPSLLSITRAMHHSTATATKHKGPTPKPPPSPAPQPPAPPPTYNCGVSHGQCGLAPDGKGAYSDKDNCTKSCSPPPPAPPVQSWGCTIEDSHCVKKTPAECNQSTTHCSKKRSVCGDSATCHLPPPPPPRRDTFRCRTPPDGRCDFVNGTSGEPYGPFNTSADCVAAKRCAARWGCSSQGFCILKKGGKYNTSEECGTSEHCRLKPTPPPPPPTYRCKTPLGNGCETVPGTNSQQGPFSNLTTCQASKICQPTYGCDASNTSCRLMDGTDFHSEQDCANSPSCNAPPPLTYNCGSEDGTCVADYDGTGDFADKEECTKSPLCSPKKCNTCIGQTGGFQAHVWCVLLLLHIYVCLCALAAVVVALARTYTH